MWVFQGYRRILVAPVLSFDSSTELSAALQLLIAVSLSSISWVSLLHRLSIFRLWNGFFLFGLVTFVLVCLGWLFLSIGVILGYLLIGFIFVLSKVFRLGLRRLPLDSRDICALDYN